MNVGLDCRFPTVQSGRPVNADFTRLPASFDPGLLAQLTPVSLRTEWSQKLYRFQAGLGGVAGQRRVLGGSVASGLVHHFVA